MSATWQEEMYSAIGRYYGIDGTVTGIREEIKSGYVRKKIKIISKVKHIIIVHAV